MPDGLALLGVPFVNGVATVVEVVGSDVVEGAIVVVLEGAAVVVVGALDVLVTATVVVVRVGCLLRLAVRRLREDRAVVPVRAARFAPGLRRRVDVVAVREPARGARTSPVAYEARVIVAPTTATTSSVRP